MKIGATQVLLAACLLALLLVLMPQAHAFDDSIDTNTAQSSGVNTQQLQSLLTQLDQQNNSQLANNPKFQQLLSQFNSSLSSGNSNLTASNLAQLQNFLSTQNSTDMLSSLVDSLQPSANGGVTIDPTKLASILKLANGLPSGVNQTNAAQEAGDLSSLANLVKNVNPQLAAQLLNAASNLTIKYGLSQSLSPGSLGSLGSLKGLKSPSIGSPKLGSSGSPKVQLELVIIPVVIVAVVLSLFVMRGKLAGLLRGQKIPGVVEEEMEPMEYDPNNPKKRIQYYFAQTIRFMKRRGISKSSSETHREFTTKCKSVSGSEHVSTISGLYEKAKFSGLEVTNDEANVAEKEFSNLANVVQVKHG